MMRSFLRHICAFKTLEHLSLSFAGRTLRVPCTYRVGAGASHSLALCQHSGWHSAATVRCVLALYKRLAGAVPALAACTHQLGRLCRTASPIAAHACWAFALAVHTSRVPRMPVYVDVCRLAALAACALLAACAVRAAAPPRAALAAFTARAARKCGHAGAACAATCRPCHMPPDFLPLPHAAHLPVCIDAPCSCCVPPRCCVLLLVAPAMSVICTCCRADVAVVAACAAHTAACRPGHPCTHAARTCRMCSSPPPLPHAIAHATLRAWCPGRPCRVPP